MNFVFFFSENQDVIEKARNMSLKSNGDHNKTNVSIKNNFFKIKITKVLISRILSVTIVHSSKNHFTAELALNVVAKQLEHVKFVVHFIAQQIVSIQIGPIIKIPVEYHDLYLINYHQVKYLSPVKDHRVIKINLNEFHKSIIRGQNKYR